MKTRSTPPPNKKNLRESGPGPGGKGRKEDVRGSGIYPASGPLPQGTATVKTQGSVGRRATTTPPGSGAAIVKRTPTQGKTAAAIVRTLPKRTTEHRKLAPLLAETPQEVPRHQWRIFLDDFSAGHEGWDANIKVFQSDETSRIEADHLSFEGIMVDLNPPDATVSVEIGEESGDHITHTMNHVTRVTALNEDDVEIEAADRSRSIVHCHRHST